MTALVAAWVTVKDASQGMRNCGTFREFREIERGHLLATGVTCLCIYIHNYVSLKKELERQDHARYVPREMRNCGTFREFREIESMYL